MRNETKHNESYLYPKNVETELTDNSTGILTVNCTSSGWPTPRIDWIVAIRGIVRRSYELPNYNVTENGQVSLLHDRHAASAMQICMCISIYIYVYIQSHVPVIIIGSCHFVSKPGRDRKTSGLCLQCDECSGTFFC